MPTPDQYLENSIEYREQHPDEFSDDDSSIENKFDWRAIRMLCVEAIPKHKAYGMSFKEYRERRESVLDEDTTERKRLSFYMPSIQAAVAIPYSIEYRCSYHRFILLLIELGLIKFQYDYHDEYSAIKRVREKSISMLTGSMESEVKFMTFSKQSIDILASGAGFRNGGSKHFVPSVPEWLYNSIADVSVYLNISISDVAYLCYCIGFSTCIPNANEYAKDACDQIISKFSAQLNVYSGIIKTIYNV